ncbi:MAG: HYR domain-containing protein [candidate division Zixibacteria bacterium]|nr:HYR domain-containing protein [candidate division Zixibacteria bacterium]
MKLKINLLILVLVFSPSICHAVNSVVVESKSVAGAASGVTIGIFLSNDVAIKNLVVPLELRSTIGGSMVTAMMRSYPSGTRLDGKLADIVITNQLDGDSVGSCKQNQPGGYARRTNDLADTLVPVTTPTVAAFFTRGRIFGADLPAGADGPTAPMMRLTVDMNGLNGKFIVDTTCTNPANHLVFARSTGTPVALIPTFTPGEITVGPPPPNITPSARDTSWATDRDHARIVTYLPASDPDDWQVLMFALLTPPAHGSTGTMSPSTGGFTYTSASHYCGPDSLQFQVCDNGSPILCDSAWVHITVNCVNDPPAAGDTALTTIQDTPLPVGYLRGSDIDPEQTLTFAILSGPEHGTISLFVPTNGSFTYAPSAGYHGPDSLKFTVCDNGSPVMCDTGTVRIYVYPPGQRPIALCRDVTVNAGTDCTAPADIDNGSNDPDFGEILTFAQLPPPPYAKGSTTVVLIVTDNVGLADTCQATVHVVDSTPPTIVCPGDFTAGTAQGQCDTTISFSGARGATATDNCSGISSISYSAPGIVISGMPPSGTLPIGTTTVTASVTDASGNFNSCEFTVTIADRQTPTVICPGSFFVPNDPGACGAIVNFNPNPGQPGSIQAFDNCGVQQIYSTYEPGFFPVGSTQVKIWASDNSGNTSDTCSFDVVVSDTSNPSFACLSDITVSTDSSQCAAVVNFSLPQVADNCPGAVVVAVPPPGSTFPKGTTIVTLTATDAAGNHKTCAFSITVTDTEKPRLINPVTVVQGNDPGTCGAVVAYSLAASDNCPGMTVSYSPPSGSFLPIGTTVVTSIATDAVGNRDSCKFNVIVSDTTRPKAYCPANIDIELPTGHTGTVISYTASATDNCPGVTVASWPGSGSFFPIGTTTVTCVATDASGNADTCRFLVAVHCVCPKQGDINGDGVIDVFDVIQVIGIAFSGYADPFDPGCPITRGDVNNNGIVDVFDVIYLISTAFQNGPFPVDPCAP